MYTCIEHIELPAKLPDYFLRINQSNINQCVCVCQSMCVCTEEMLPVEMCWGGTMCSKLVE